jgi:hypothetical protein
MDVSRGYVSQFFTRINDEATLLRIVSKDSYDFTTVVDTICVELLQDFKWAKIRTDTGVYFSARVTNRAYEKWKDTINFDDKQQVQLHRLVAMRYHPNPNKFKYVDHIDRHTLDNRIKNLRWLSQSDQNRNQDKKKRQSTARDLPLDIEQVPLPKYINWNPETLKNGTVRTFFRIECHPALKGKQWSTTKSKKFSNQEKLNEAKKKLVELDALVNSDPEEPIRTKLVGEFMAFLATK